MATEPDFAAAGRMVRKADGLVVFRPRETNYELQLKPAVAYTGPMDKPVRGVVRVTARKIWTVPSGGNFIAPIFGPPKTIQGRIKHIGDKFLVVQAGLPVIVDVPKEHGVLALAEGALAVGVMVNVTAMPGASIELVVDS
jgi:hypothetical protein